MPITSKELKSNLNVMELVDWLLFNIPPTQYSVPSLETTFFLDAFLKKEKLYKISTEKYAEIERTFFKIMDEIISGFLPLYGYKTYEPWHNYIKDVVKTKKELIYKGQRKGEDNLIYLPELLADYYPIILTKQKITKEDFEKWRNVYTNHYEKLKKNRRFQDNDMIKQNELPFDSAVKKALKDKACFSFVDVTMKREDVMNVFRELRKEENKILSRTVKKESELSFYEREILEIAEDFFEKYNPKNKNILVNLVIDELKKRQNGLFLKLKRTTVTRYIGNLRLFKRGRKSSKKPAS